MGQSNQDELVIVRTFDAPQWLVWQAWTESSHMMQWACPDDFTLLYGDGELRPGGKWRSAMRTPDGEELSFGGTYREVVPCERLVFTHVWNENGSPGHETIVTVQLAEHQGKTTMTFRQSGFLSVESRDGHKDGWGQAFDHLVRHLQQTMDAAPHELTLTRIFDAPRELVWKVWTEPGHVAQWWGPHGFTNPLCQWDARSGNPILVHMRGPKGSPFDFDMPMGGVFETVLAPERLVFITNALPNENGKPQISTRNTVTFEELNGKTKVTLHAVVLHFAPAAAGALAGMEQGWTQSLEKLAALLEELS